MQRYWTILLLLILSFNCVKAQNVKIKNTITVPASVPFNDDSGLLPDKYGVFNEPEIEPMFPGGTKAYQKFMMKNLKWPDESRMIDVRGKVMVSFVVEKDGRLTNFKVIRRLHPLFDNEALRVIKLSPNWIPGKIDGKTVRSRYVIPVNFSLDN